MKPFLVGVTGHIGAGKSTLLNYLKYLGFFVINTDTIAKNIIYTEENCNLLISFLGPTIIDNNGKYDFKEIRKIIFKDSSKRNLLERIFSNEIWEEIKRLADNSEELIVFIENAVLYEQKWDDHFNFVICIHCEQEEAIRRITKSRNMTRDEVIKILSCQKPIEEKIKKADISIDTTHLKENKGHIYIKKTIEIFRKKYSAPFLKF